VSIFARLADGKRFDDSEVAAGRAGEWPTRADTGALFVRSKGRIDSSAVVHRLRVFFRAVRRAQCEPVQPAIWLARSTRRAAREAWRGAGEAVTDLLFH
jgi:hypothetical protein